MKLLMMVWILLGLGLGLQARVPVLPKVAPLTVKVPAFEVHQLSCGLRVLLLKDDGLPLVSCSLAMPGGTVEDPAGKEGTISILQNLLRDGGAGSRGPVELDEAVEAKAAELWAGAGKEAYTAGFKCLSADVDDLLGLFADMLLRPRLDAGRFEAVRQEKLDYFRRVEETPDSATQVMMDRGFWKGHPYGHWASEKSLQTVTRADVEKQFRRHWGPASAVLSLAGSFDETHVLNRLESLFAGWKPQESRPDYAETALAGDQIYFLPKDTAQVSVRLAYVGLKRHDPDYFPMLVANEVLGGGSFTSRLMREIRSNRGLAYGVDSGLEPLNIVGPFLVDGSTRPDAAAEYVRLQFKLVRDFATHGPTERELQQAQTAMVQEFAYGFESPHRLANEAGDLLFKGYPQDYLATYRDQVKAVTRAQAGAAARRILLDKPWVMVVCGPASLEKELQKFGPVKTLKSVFDPL
jgi:zinc protease